MVTKNKRQTVYARQLAVRFKEGEFLKLEAEAERGGVTKTDFVRQCCRKGYAVSEEGLNRLRVELNMIGSNLNQLARAANMSGHDDSMYQDALSEIIELRRIVEKIRAGKKW